MKIYVVTQTEYDDLGNFFNDFKGVFASEEIAREFIEKDKLHSPLTLECDVFAHPNKILNEYTELLSDTALIHQLASIVNIMENRDGDLLAEFKETYGEIGWK